MGKDRFFTWGLIIMSVVLLIIVFAIGWMQLVDGRIVNPVIEYGVRSSSGITHETTKTSYYPGEKVYARVIFRKCRNIPGELQWELINDKVTMYPSRPGSLPIGIWDHVVPVEVIPYDTEPGEHWFAGTIKYRINWLSTVTYPMWTNKFNVVKP